MDNIERQRLINKIDAMLRNATANSNIYEAKVAWNKAFEFMLKYDLNSAEIPFFNSKNSSPEPGLPKNNYKDLTYIDKRSKGGALWIIGGSELQPYFDICQQNGIKFYFKPEGGHASCGKPAWWTIDNTNLDDILSYFNKR